jgi:hypothetical protein
VYVLLVRFCLVEAAGLFRAIIFVLLQMLYLVRTYEHTVLAYFTVHTYSSPTTVETMVYVQYGTYSSLLYVVGAAAMGSAAICTVGM